MNYLRNKKTYDQQSESPVQQSNVESRRHPDEFRIQSLLIAISRGRFKYYVCGGFCRGRGVRLEPLKLARFHKLNIDDCLFEIKDQRIEDAVDQFGLKRVTPNSHSRGPKAVNIYLYPESPVRPINMNITLEGDM
jgi:hypothetical protein